MQEIVGEDEGKEGKELSSSIECSFTRVFCYHSTKTKSNYDWLKKQRKIVIYIVSNFFKQLKAVDLLSEEINQNRIVIGSPVVRSSVRMDGNNRFLNLLRHTMRINHLSHNTNEPTTYIQWGRSISHILRTTGIPGLYTITLPRFPIPYEQKDQDA